MVYTCSSGTQWAETGRSLFVDVSLIYIEYFRITRTIGRLHLKKCHLRSSCEMNYVILRQLLVWWKQNPCCKFWECVGLRLRKNELRWLQSKCYISLSKHYSLAAVDILNKHKSAKPEYVLVALSESWIVIITGHKIKITENVDCGRQSCVGITAVVTWLRFCNYIENSIVVSWEFPSCGDCAYGQLS